MGFYNSSTSVSNRSAGYLYSQSAEAEFPNIDLRTEFNELIDGTGGYGGLGQFVLLRKMNRSGTKCACWDAEDGSSSDCKYCHGETYTWTEEFHRGHFTQTYGRSLTAATNAHILFPQGYFDQTKAVIYMKYDAEPQNGDAIFRIRLTTEGSAYYNSEVERIEKWRVVSAEDRRDDGGRVAFWICVCERVEA